MAKAGGRKYNRDKNGKFASTGGGGSKAASTRSANSARAADLKAKGTTAIGGRVKAKGFAGGKGAQERAGGIRKRGGVNLGKSRPGVSAPKGTLVRSGGKSGFDTDIQARSAAQKGGYGKGSKASAPAAKPAAKKGPKTAAGRASANLKAAEAKPAPAAKASKPKATSKPATGSRDRRASQMAAEEVNNRRLEGRKLRGKGKTPMARADRNLERAMTTPGKKSVRSEKVARAAIDYYAAKGTGGKKKRGKK